MTLSVMTKVMISVTNCGHEQTKWVYRTFWSHFDFGEGSHDFGHEVGHEIGFHDFFRELSVMATTFGDRDRGQRSRRFFWLISGVFMTRLRDRQPPFID